MSAANNVPAHMTTTQDTLSKKQLIAVLRGAAILAVVLATVACVGYLYNGLDWRSRSFPGFLMSYTLVVDGSQTFGGDEWSAQAAGLQRLDRITGVNGTDFPATDYALARSRFTEVMGSLSYGDEVSLEFVRPVDRLREGQDLCDRDDVTDGFVPCRVTYTLSPMTTSDFLTLFAFPYVTAVIALLVGITLLIYRPDDANALLITIFCVSLAVFSGGLFNNASTHFFMPLWLGFTAVGGTVAFSLALSFPTRVGQAYRQPVLLAVPPVVGGVLLAIDLSLFAAPPTPYHFSIVWQIPVGVAFFGFLSLFTSLVRRRRYVTSSVHHDQVNTGLIGMMLSLIPILLWVVSYLALAFDSAMVLPFNSATTMPFFITVPISLAYAMLQYREFDTDQFLSQGITYGIMLGALVIGYFFMVLGVKLLAQEMIPSDNPFIIATTIFVIAVGFLPVRTRLQNRIDRIFFRERRDFQNQVEAFGRQISTTHAFDNILKLYVERLQSTLSCRGVFIFLPDDERTNYVVHYHSNPNTDVRFEAKSDMIKLLNQSKTSFRVAQGQRWAPGLVTERNRLKILKANVIIPLRAGRDTVSGFVIIGPPHADRIRYSYEEIRFADSISSQMAVAVERAQVVESLESRVRELGVLSQVSQAVNFAVEFDDLLELISAQTQKVLEAPNFYIALRDTAAPQMYYAFFMEQNERLRELENSRWNAGGDIFARIVENGQAESLDNYTQAVTNRHLESRGIANEIKAWMGVPMVAGQTNLGVIAVGSTRSDYIYSDEQLRIFSDLGALAATSLDKARLFEEANLRARQLAALNDISRRLQSERRVERLIPLITENAVDILGAEAGSLLLRTDDGSGDMEFRIVVGGSGQELVGTRIEAGHGIVGEVAQTGDAVIVNNTKEDARWAGEVSTNTDFQTTSVLAVPLMANNEVIGVLEVLNKLDGTAYRKEDADVLETFAGQAAIAIDNAQLFEKTDEQLSLRVQELETLEKIDAELNRALDLQRIAEITVKWAIANTGASAGMLGLVAEQNPPINMRILHTYGYQESDLPDSIENNLLPLDRGIVSRVIRTKKPDLQTDVSIDPDYVPSLRQANSQMTIPIMAGEVIIALLILEKNYKPPLGLLDQAFVQRLTEHAAIAIENARLYRELESTNKAQSRYMGVGAHELKNALAPIKGWTDFLMSGMLGTVTDQQENSLKVIKSNVGRAELIIQDLRDFARMQANELRVRAEPTSMRNIVVETLRTFTQQLEDKDQRLVNHIINKELPDIMGDSQRLIQVMTNFISNANKYSPEEATITLDAEVLENRPDDQPDALMVSIADTGMGIGEEDQKKMFQPYFRTQQAEESDIPGTGLGMSLTKEIIMQHGGDVWLESELGVGTTFFFTIPLATEADTQATDEQAEVSP